MWSCHIHFFHAGARLLVLVQLYSRSGETTDGILSLRSAVLTCLHMACVDFKLASIGWRQVPV
jgi:hypothetical protein